MSKRLIRVELLNGDRVHKKDINVDFSTIGIAVMIVHENRYYSFYKMAGFNHVQFMECLPPVKV